MAIERPTSSWQHRTTERTPRGTESTTRLIIECEWKPVRATVSYTTNLNNYNRVTFDRIETTALRLQVQLQPNASGGVLEWRVK